MSYESLLILDLAATHAGANLKTIFDVISISLFAGLAILYLQRSASKEPDEVALWKYAVAAIACAVADYLGNNGQTFGAAAMFVFVVAFSILMLKPFSRPSN